MNQNKSLTTAFTHTRMQMSEKSKVGYVLLFCVAL